MMMMILDPAVPESMFSTNQLVKILLYGWKFFFDVLLRLPRLGMNLFIPSSIINLNFPTSHLSRILMDQASYPNLNSKILLVLYNRLYLI